MIRKPRWDVSSFNTFEALCGVVWVWRVPPNARRTAAAGAGAYIFSAAVIQGEAPPQYRHGISQDEHACVEMLLQLEPTQRDELDGSDPWGTFK